jgi:ankyrin repeat protein
MVKALVAKGALVNINFTDIDLLSAALDSGKNKIIKFLLNNGINIYTHNKGVTALENAFQQEDKEIIILILEKISDYNLQYFNGKTCLYLACKYHNLDAIDYLLKQGANPSIANIDGNTPFHIAIFNSYEWLLDTLIEQNKLSKQTFSINHAIYAGFSLLSIAIDYKKPEIVAYLLEKRATNIFVVEADGATPLYRAIKQDCENKNTEYFDILKEHMHFKNAYIYKGMNALHVATLYGGIEIIEALIEIKHTDINAKTADTNQTALHIAISTGNTKIVRRLLRAGCNPMHKDIMGKTAIYILNFKIRIFDL